MKRGQYNKTFPDHFDFGSTSRKAFGESCFNRYVKQVKASAYRRGIICRLSKTVFRKLTKGNCVYCGVPPNQRMTDKEAYGFYLYNGIDRKNPDRGYVLDNCVSCCGICNRAKSNLPFAVWKTWILRLTKHNS